MTEKRQTAGPIEGEALSPGVVKGCLVLLTAGARPIRSVSAGGPDREVEPFHGRIALLLDRLGRDIRQLRKDGLTAEAEIVEMHLFRLRDRTFQRKVENLVRGNADAAVEEVLGAMIERLERSGNVLLAARRLGRVRRGKGHALVPRGHMGQVVRYSRAQERVYSCSRQCRDEYLSRQRVPVRGVL